MNRSPLPAWRRLFAAGGAPAAAHAALSRAPASEHLLEPMLRVRLAAETSLDALARPIDLSSVLSRVLEGMSVTQSNVSEENEAPVRTRSGTPRVVGTSTPTSGMRQIGNTGSEPSAARNTNGLPPTPVPSRKRIAANDSLRVDDPARSAPRIVSADVTGSYSNDAPPRTTAARTTVPFARRSALVDAQLGANARIIVDAPVEGIARLLALGDPSAMTAPRRRSTAQTNGPTMEPSTSDAARTLASAVDRVAARRAATSVPQRGEPRWHAPANAETLIAEDRGSATPGGNRTAESVTAIVNDAPSNGGFRGLARRTLVANGAAQHIPVRLGPEVRTPSDLSLDTLDARVAESLARILEREARRHGVDVAESRA